MGRRLVALLFVAAAVVSARGERAAGAPPAEVVPDRDDIDVTTDVVVRPGTYRVKDANGDGVLRVKADGVSVTMTGVVLDGAAAGETADRFEGVGVSVVGRKGVTIEGGAVRGYRVGVRGEGAPGIVLSGIDVSGSRRMRLRSTPAREDEADWLWPHENDEGQWENRYGAGISLTACPKALVRGCRGHEGQDGLLLSRCDEAAVFDDDFSFNSGWGVALWRTSRSEVSHVKCDWCVRGYSHGVYARGQDSAGILVFEQCSDNLFAFDSATHSGDGFFLYAGNETLKVTGKGGCNRNKVARCDFSHAVANGIEATFSAENEFAGNRLDDCEHAVWAGYSYRTRIEGNTAERCANGISIEHGHDNRVAGNSLSECGTGVHLWWDDDKDLLASVYGRSQVTDSTGTFVESNWITGGGTAIDLDGDTASRIQGNTLVGAKRALRLAGKSGGITFSGNNVVPEAGGISVRNDTDRAFETGPSNWWGGAGPRFEGRSPVAAPRSAEKEFRLGSPAPRLERLAVRGSIDPFLPRDALRGRRYILVDEWGPVDPRVPRLFPAEQSASGSAPLSILGVAIPWRVTSLTEGFVADPESGKAPATFRVRRAPDAKGPSLDAFRVTVRAGDKDLAAKGTLLAARWRVSFFAWTKDPRTDAATWRALVAGPPLDAIETDGLDFSWGPGKPTERVPADHFGTVAEATLTLPEGRWKVSTVSDDGVRVLVDGKVVLEDWTWHAPKEDTATIALPAGAHAVRVEHFEIDGNATLRLAVEPSNERR